MRYDSAGQDQLFLYPYISKNLTAPSRVAETPRKFAFGTFATRSAVSLLQGDQMETRNITNPAAEMERKLEGYFAESNTKCTVSVSLAGRIADATIYYDDFKPTRVVRREIEDYFPDINISEIHRCYSNEAKHVIMQELLDEDIEIFLPYNDGSLRPLCIGELIEERLFHRTLNFEKKKA